MLANRCEHCHQIISADRDRLGARCLLCRQPLYEDPFLHQREADLRDRPGVPRCPVHAGNRAVGTCRRCGAYLCRFCWTRWQGRPLCVACVNRIMSGNAQGPGEARSHFHQALWGALLGALAWGLLVIGVVLFFLGMPGEGPGAALIGLGFLVIIPSPIPAVIGIGQAAAAVRVRGEHMILATIGLLLSGLHIGILLGGFAFYIIHTLT